MRSSSTQAPFQLVTPVRVLLFIGVLSLVCGLGLKRRNLTFLGGSCLTICVASLLTLPDLRKIQLKREHLSHTFEGEQLTVALSAAFPSNASIPDYLELTDRFSSGERKRIQILLPDSNFRDKSLKVNYSSKVSDRRGLSINGPVQLQSSDPLGLFSVHFTNPLFTNLLIYPQAAIIDEYAPLRTFCLRHLGEHTIAREGLSQEFMHIREYSHGDSPRYVHWPTSLRQQSLFVKALEDNTQSEVAIFLDLFQLSHTGIGNHTSTEMLVAAAASVATFAAELGHYIRMEIISGKPLTVPLGAGHGHLHAILRELALIKSDGRGNFVAKARNLSVTLRRGSSLVIVISLTSVEDSLLALIKELKDRELRIGVVAINDRSFPTLYMAQQMRSVEAGSTEEIIAQLTDAGAEVTMLSKGDDIREKLELSA
jgi:uncharacterized protein (DUF58 family)